MTIRKIQRFEIREELGSGGVGTVMRAYDPQLERDVAIKVLTNAAVAAELSADDTIDLRGNAPNRDELLREARMMAKLSHPNVLPVYEVGLADGAVFVVMEHIAGDDLEAWLEEPRATAAILEVFAQAGRGLAAAHASGIVHRDFKPANVLVGRDGRVRVADFGLSKLVALSTAMVQVDDGRGTPRYMAPELWDGKPATVKSDVYAFCLALDRALGGQHLEDPAAREQRWRERGLSARLHALLAAGLDSEPVQRPELSTVLAAIEAPTRRPLWLYGAVAGALAIGGVVAAFAMRESKSCDVDPNRFANGWNATKRSALVAALAKEKSATGVTPEKLAAGVDRITKSHLDELRNICLADPGKSTAKAREACVQRRAFEVAANVDRAIAAPRPLDELFTQLSMVPNVEDCREMTSASITNATASLVQRYVAAFELAVPAKSKEHSAVLEAIERDARAAGELDVAQRAAYQLSAEYRFQDKLKESDAAAQRSYVDAVALRWQGNSIDAMLMRSKLAAERGDFKQATELAETARSLATSPSTTELTRARLTLEVGRAKAKGGDQEAAIKLLQEALDLAVKSPRRERYTEVDIRFTLVNALASAPGRGPRAVELGKETVAWAKQEFGENDTNYGIAINVLAIAHRSNNDLASALELRKQAIANMRATMPADSAPVLRQRADMVGDLNQLGKLEEARAELVDLIAATAKNEALRPTRWYLVAVLGITLFELGKHDEGARLIDQGREEAVAQMGLSHPSTISLRQYTAGMLMELQQYDAAENQIRILEEAHRSAADPRSALVTQGTNKAWLTLVRGKAAEAERLAKTALDGLRELKGGDDDIVGVMLMYAETLLAQKRWAEARTQVEAAAVIARKLHWRADRMASLEVQLARAEVGLGLPEGMERAKRASDELAKWPGQLQARRDVAAILKRR